MGVPWAYGPKQFSVTAGQAALIQLNVPHRGAIRTFSLTSPDATVADFEIYSSEAAARQAVADANGSSASVPAEIHPAGFIVYDGNMVNGRFFASDLRARYVNTDGTPTNPVGRLWMRLKDVNGSGVVQFNVSIVIEGADF